MEHEAESTKQGGRSQSRGAPARRALAEQAPLHPMLQLQRTIGNQAVLSLFRSGAIQAKLAVSSPDNPEEKTADEIADKVMRKQSGAGAIGACTCAAGGEMCEECRKKQPEAPVIQRRAASGAAGMSDAPALVHQTLGGAGRPLDMATRTDMESRFGRDFGAVRIHTDRQAAESAKSIDALAYTLGDHIAFGEGQFAPHSEAGGRLLAHELTHVLQQDAPQSLRRDTDPKASLIQAPANPAPAAPDPVLHPYPTTGERVIFAGRELTESPEQLTNLAWNLVAFGYPELMISPGRGAPSDFATRIQSAAFRWSAGAVPCPAPDDPNYEDCHRSQVLRDKIVIPFSKVVEAVDNVCEADLTRFQEQARQNALDILKANEQQAEAEAKAYGIKMEDVTVEAVGFGMIDYASEVTVTQYSMDEKSEGALNLRKAAQLLLKRREAIYAKRDEQNDHMFVDPMSGYAAMDDQYENIGKEVERLEGEYNASRAILSTQFPLLAAFSELDPSAIKKGDSELRKLAETAPGQDIARMVGEKIHDTLQNIKKSRDGLDPKNDEVNVWTLDDIVKLTRVQLDVDADPAFNVLVDERVRHEQPGILHDIALAVLNIVAILLAPETGGLSLVAAAGVNAAVAASHVEDYLTKKALVGSAFDKARALSQDDPSLFWLAFEIVGTVVDVGAAAHAVATFRSVASLTKVAIAAKEGKEATEALEALRFAAEEAKGPAFAEQVLAKVNAARKGEASIKGFEEESKLLAEAGKSSEIVAAPAQAGRVIEEEAIETGHLAEASFEQGGHTYQILKDGRIVRCSKWCANLEFLYDDLFKRYSHLSENLTSVKALKGAEAKEAAALLAERMELVSRADKMSLSELEKLLDQPEFAIRTQKGIDLRFVRYQKEGGALPFNAWLAKAESAWDIGELGSLTERELKEAYDLGPKNNLKFNPPTGQDSFIPDHIAGNPKSVEWGKPYHFKEIKDWANMSDTGNLSAMLDYVSSVPGSRITIFYRSSTYMSGPLRSKIWELVAKGQAELIPYAGR